MIREELLLIITKEITGQASEDEKDVLRDWLSESRENSSLYHSFKEAFLNGKYKLKAKNKDEVFDKLSTRLHFEGHRAEINTHKKISLPSQFFSRWLKITATLLIFLTSAFIIYQTRDYWRPLAEEDTLAHEVIIKSNPHGKKSLITLPDGSKVKLNSESHLEYFSDFEHERGVKLIGEAFFEIVKDSLRPFYVSTGDLRIRVLGTSFNVEAFPFEKNINVALVTGKVLIERKEGMEIKPVDQLNPHEMLIYDHQSAEYDITEFNAKSVIGWKDGELHFDETDLHDVMETLERWYGVEITVSSTADLSGRINDVTYKNEPLDFVLEAIGFMSGFEAERKGKKVYIK